MKEKKENWFVRILIILLCLLIAAMACYNFFIAEPKGIISNGLIVLLILLIILVLSEAFDNIALGKILSLNKKVEEKKVEVNELKSEKQNLLNMLVSNISVQSQSVGISGRDLKEILTVIKADPERVNQETKEKEGELEETKPNVTPRKGVDHKRLEEMLLDQYVEENNLAEFILNQQVTFSKNFSAVDPISRVTPIYDGYIETEDSEIFIEVKLQRVTLYTRANLYTRLSALYHYRQAKQVKAYLQLILVEMPEDQENGRALNAEDRIRKDFEPAIDLGILKVKYVKLDEEKAKEVYR